MESWATFVITADTDVCVKPPGLPDLQAKGCMMPAVKALTGFVASPGMKEYLVKTVPGDLGSLCTFERPLGSDLLACSHELLQNREALEKDSHTSYIELQIGWIPGRIGRA